VPPAVVKTVSDLIFWQYAKIIAASAGFKKEDYGFVTKKFKQLKQQEIFWNEIREYIKEKEQTNECIYCGTKTNLTLEHLLPRCFNGPDYEKNIVWICKPCNSSKGSKRLYEYWIDKYGLKTGKNRVPRIAEGKYLKFAFEVLENKGFLTLSIEDIAPQVCPRCDLKNTCIKERTENKLSVLCLDGILTLCFKEN
jgi:rubrerythrin